MAYTFTLINEEDLNDIATVSLDQDDNETWSLAFQPHIDSDWQHICGGMDGKEASMLWSLFNVLIDAANNA